MTEPQEPLRDIDALVRRVTALESLDELDDGQLDDYVTSESELEQILFERSIALSVNCEYDDANELLDEVIDLNTTMRGIADRQAALPDAPQDTVRLLAHLRDQADGLILFMHAQKLVNRAEENVVGGDLYGAIVHLNSAREYLDELRQMDVSAAGFAVRYLQLIEARLPALAAVQEMRSGNFRSAHDSLDRSRVLYEEFRAQLTDEQAGDDPQEQAVHADMARTLSEGLSNAMALQGLVDLLLALQSGDFADAVDRGKFAAPLYEAAVEAARRNGRPRNLIAVREMERAYLLGWLALAQAELAIERADWTGCRTSIRESRERFNDGSRLVMRNLYAGLMAQIPDTAGLELLLRNAARRCEREERLTMRITELNVQLGRAVAGRTVVYNSAEAAAAARSTHQEIVTHEGDNVSTEFTFEGPVTATSIGNENEVINPTLTTVASGGLGDLQQLAAALASLRSAMDGTPLGSAEKASLDYVREAEDAARRSDETSVRRQLAAAGMWALKVAQQLGITVAAAAIKHAIGA